MNTSEARWFLMSRDDREALAEKLGLIRHSSFKRTLPLWHELPAEFKVAIVAHFVANPEQVKPLVTAPTRIAEAQAEGRLKLNRYDHGGGRLWIETKDGGRELICDLYEEDTRELILKLLGVTL